METKDNTKILIVDDDTSNLDVLAKIVEREGFATLLASGGRQGIELFKENDVDLVITDLSMPDIDGFTLLKEVKEALPHIEVIVVTAHGTIEKAVAAMREGAYDFITKPFDRMSIVKQLHKALEKQQLLKENEILKGELEKIRAGDKIIGSSPSVLAILENVEQVAPTDATILILGESGTGKELIARALHRTSSRASKKFVGVSCTTLPENLLEAELFGYEKGAFTGAARRKEGRFEWANGGSLFLDEIGDLPLPLQGKLLRVLEEGEFERLGGNQTLSVDTRIIAATNRDLLQAVERQEFREDLYYRLNVIQIKLPALRERKQDIPLLANHFLQVFNLKNGKSIEAIDEPVMRSLEGYNWPGNVRQLRNTIERAVVFCRSEAITMSDLPELDAPTTSLSWEESEELLRVPLGMKMRDIEKKVIEETLKRTAGDKNKAADLLGIASRTIYRKLL